MKSVKSAIAAGSLALAGAAIGGSAPAVAGDGYGHGNNVVFPVAIVSGADVTKRTQDGYLGLYAALNGNLDRDGVIVRVLGSHSRFDYSYGSAHSHYGMGGAGYGVLGNVDGRGWQGDAMIGYQWIRNGFEFSAMVGVDHQSYKLSPDDVFSRLRGTETGFKAVLDLETSSSNKGPLYMALRGAYSTAFDTYYGLARVGYKRDRFAFGPEFWAIGDVSGDAMRVGGFMLFDIPFSATRVGQLSFSAGYQFADNNDRRTGFGKGFEDGAYGTMKFNIALGREGVSHESYDPRPLK